MSPISGLAAGKHYRTEGLQVIARFMAREDFGHMAAGQIHFSRSTKGRSGVHRGAKRARWSSVVVASAIAFALGALVPADTVRAQAIDFGDEVPSLDALKAALGGSSRVVNMKDPQPPRAHAAPVYSQNPTPPSAVSPAAQGWGAPPPNYGQHPPGASSRASSGASYGGSSAYGGGGYGQPGSGSGNAAAYGGASDPRYGNRSGRQASAAPPAHQGYGATPSPAHGGGGGFSMPI